MQHLSKISMEKVETKNTHHSKKLNVIQTSQYLKDALSGKDLDMFKSVRIDRKEAAKFIERLAKIMRFVSISAELPTITFLAEEIYYSAFEQSILKEMNDFQEFRNILNVQDEHSLCD